MEVVLTPPARGRSPNDPIFVNNDEQGIANFTPLLNDEFGGEMAINAGFSGTPQIIHDGGDTSAWTPSILSGTWNFADTTNPFGGSAACISSITVTNPSEALFTIPSGVVDPTNWVGISGEIFLESWGGNIGDKTVTIQLRLAGTPVGTPVAIETVIDVTMLDEYQVFFFTWAQFGITTETFDEIVVAKSKTVGLVPDFRLDDFNIEEAGTSVVFNATPFPGTQFICKAWTFNFIDNNYTTTAHGNLDHETILSRAKLIAGISVQIVQGGEVVSSVQLRNMGDFLASGSFVETHVFFGSRTQVTLKVVFDGPLILRDDTESLRLRINDNLTSLTSFTSLVAGRTEITDLDAFLAAQP